MTEQLILNQLKKMPEHLKREVLDFVGFLVEKHQRPIPQPVSTVTTQAGNQAGYLSKEEIVRLYPDEWVLLANFRKEGVEILGGKVLMHDKDKRNLAQRAQHESFPDTPKTVYFTGQLPNRRRIGLLQKINP